MVMGTSKWIVPTREVSPLEKWKKPKLLEATSEQEIKNEDPTLITPEVGELLVIPKAIHV